MAVKKHELVHDNRNQLDLHALAQYIQLINEQPGYLPPPQELVKNCQDIVKCLARTSGKEDQLWGVLQSIEEFLIRAVSTGYNAVRHEIVTTILDKFYSFISDPQSDACPAVSIVLIVLDNSNMEATLSAARWLVQQGDNGPAGAGLRASLSCLYSWLYNWRGTPALGDWVLAFIQALEENERFDILIEVSLDNLGRLFLALENPVLLRQSVADVIFHMLASLRESTEAFDRISANVGRVLTNLAADSGQWSRQLLQNVVDILTATVDGLVESLKGEAQDMFKDKYHDVSQCLERHMVSRGCRFLQMAPWRARNVCLTSVSPHAPTRKVGLLNLGNTCYMNSVMQALLVTRQFSTHVVLNMTAVPYWAKMAIFFGKMMHSVSTKLNPSEVFSVVKPPFFIRNNQHDSSEFLGYLFELLQSYEHQSDVNFDYTRPPVLASSSRLRLVSQLAQSSSDAEHADASPNRRSVSPRPGGSDLNQDGGDLRPGSSGPGPGGSGSRPGGSGPGPGGSGLRTGGSGSRPGGSGQRPSSSVSRRGSKSPHPDNNGTRVNGSGSRSSSSRSRPSGSTSRPSSGGSRPSGSSSRTGNNGTRPSGSGSSPESSGSRPNDSGSRTSGSSSRPSGSGSRSSRSSPRPGSSVAGSSTGGQKRSSPDMELESARKRIRMQEPAFLRRDSYIDSMFGGVLLTRVQCTECRSSSLSRDVFRDLQLAFPDKPEGWQYSVQSLLEYYCSSEILTGDNRYQCRDCGGLREAERSVLVEATPKYLILVLKNFKFEPKLQVQTKLMHSMFHNQAITLPAVRSQAVHSKYTLYAAVIHAGTTLDSGHYYTLAKDNDQWHMYNDEEVSAADESQLSGLNRSSTPYILFYRRTDVEEGTAPAMQDLPPKVQESVMAHDKHYVETVRKMRLTRP